MFQLQILSPQGQVFNDSVDELLLPTEMGEIEILSHHIPLFTKITEGVLTIKKSDKKTLIAIIGGFLEVKNETATILSDYAVRAENIQVAQAQEAKKKAEDLMLKKESTADLIMAQRDLQKSVLELKVAEKIKHHL